MRDRHRTGRRAQLMGTLPYLVGGAVLIAYFVWICLEMASHADGGYALPAAIFGAVLVGILAGAASMVHRPSSPESEQTITDPVPKLNERNRPRSVRPGARESTASRTASRSGHARQGLDARRAADGRRRTSTPAGPAAR